jgi:hypothetical protein
VLSSEKWSIGFISAFFFSVLKSIQGSQSSGSSPFLGVGWLPGDPGFQLISIASLMALLRYPFKSSISFLTDETSSLLSTASFKFFSVVHAVLCRARRSSSAEAASGPTTSWASCKICYSPRRAFNMLLGVSEKGVTDYYQTTNGTED